jgi:hypothetical protein
VPELVQLIGVIVWPTLIGLVLCGFRVPIWSILTSVANRSVKVGAQGLELSAPPQQTPVDASAASPQGLPPAASVVSTTKTGSGPIPIAKRFAVPLHDFVSEVEKIVDELIPHLMQQFNIAKEDALKYAVVDNLSALRLERASRNIFGSQIDAINVLNGRGGRLPIDALRSIYTNATVAFPQIYTNYTFDQWLAYLTGADLIRIDGSDAVVTPAGKVIISYMQGWGYLATRPPG